MSGRTSTGRRPASRGALALALVLALSGAAPAGATGLVAAWEAARRHDAELDVARAAQRAGQARRGQAPALWRPNVALTAAGGVGRADTAIDGARFSAPGFGTVTGAAFDTSIDAGASGRIALAARQPIYDRERSAQSRQLTLSADIADLEWEAAQQALMLRTAEHWLAVSLATEALRVASSQQQAVDRTLAEATDRYRIGDAPVTGTHEARARAESVRAQVLAARTDREIRLDALADLTGLPREVLLDGPARPGAPPAAPLDPLARWIDEAAQHNPGIRIRQIAAQVAREDASKHARSWSPTVEVVAQVAQERISGNGDFGSASSGAGNALIGLQLSVPLYTGGFRDARHEETLRLVEKADAELEKTRRDVARHVRAAWLGLDAGAARVAALEQALVASDARLASTRTGHQVGDRTTLDLLDAQNASATAALALTQARVALLVDRLRLAALAGRLDERLLHEVDAAADARK